MNPWLSIWTEPRATIASIIRENPNRNIWILAWIYGLLSLLNGSQSLVLGNTFHFMLILILSILVAPLWGMVVFGIWSWVVRCIGKILKGKGTFGEIRAAFAWSCVPLSINIVLWILLLIVFGKVLFESSQPNTGSMVFLMFILIAKLIVMIWSLVIFIKTLAVVQRFSIGRSIANILLSWIAIGIVVGIFWVCIGYFIQASLSPSQAVLNITLGMQL